MKKTYEFENLGCAHCAGKMEEKIGKLPDVESVNLSFPMKKMYVETSREDLLPEIQKICTDIEPDVIVTEVTKNHLNGENMWKKILMKVMNIITITMNTVTVDVITTIMNMSTSNIITIMMITATAGVNTITKNMNTITIMMTTAIVAAVMMTMTMMNQLQLLQIVKEMVRQPYLLSRN